jgi:Raf kinase inhibitor-like YbhB/YbcL family protein
VVRLCLPALALALLPACSGEEPGVELEVPAGEELDVAGPFEDGAAIPSRLTCDGADRSPELSWGRLEGTGSFAIVMTDPDADDFVHWVAWGISPEATGISEGELPAGASEGTNSFGDVGYSGPCPPEGDGPHTYRIAVYAVRTDPSEGLQSSSTATDVLDAIQPEIAGAGVLRGTYER